MLHLIAGLLLNFNPLPRKEGDTNAVQICHRFPGFQSTPS